jgi:hypothetical protein
MTTATAATTTTTEIAVLERARRAEDRNFEWVGR